MICQVFYCHILLGETRDIAVIWNYGDYKSGRRKNLASDATKKRTGTELDADSDESDTNPEDHNEHAENGSGDDGGTPGDTKNAYGSVGMCILCDVF